MSALATKAPDSSTVEIRRYEPAMHREVVSLITGIQQNEFHLPITYEDQFDLKDMQNTYQSGKGNFWVALHEDVVVGTIGLIDVGDKTAALKKMFVLKACRGKDLMVAQTLLATLLHWAKDKGIEHIYLGTTEVFLAAHRFYERNGFRFIANETLPDAILPTRGKVDTKHYYLRLA